MLSKLKGKKGFTLIEMLVVIAIIAVLVAIIVPVVSSATTKAKAATDAANLRSTLASATVAYLANNTVAATDLGTVPAAKSVTATSIVIAKSGNTLVAYYVSGNSYYTVGDFAKVASAGGAVTATGTAPEDGDVIVKVASLK